MKIKTLKFCICICIFVINYINAQEWQYVGKDGKLTGLFSGFFGNRLDNNQKVLSKLNPINGSVYAVFATGFANYNSDYKLSVLSFNGIDWDKINTDDIILNQGGADFYIDFNTAGVPFIAYSGENNILKVVSFDGSNWNNLGNTSFFVYNGLDFSISPNGVPFIAGYQNGSNQGTKVVSFDGENWNIVGDNLPISSSQILKHSLTFKPNGVPVLAYTDRLNNYQSFVKTFDGLNWSDNGSNINSLIGHPTNIQKIICSPNGTIFLSIIGQSPYRSSYVISINGNNWGKVGDIISSNYSYQEPLISQDITIDKNGFPVVTYSDLTISNNTVVKKFNGLNWSIIGTSSGFSSGFTKSQNILIDKNERLYVSSIVESNGFKPTVSTFDGFSWGSICRIGNSKGSSSNHKLEFSPTGKAFLAFKDDASFKRPTIMSYLNNAWTPLGGIEGINSEIDFDWETYNYSMYISNNEIPFFSFNSLAGNEIIYFETTNWIRMNFDFTGFQGSGSMSIGSNGLPIFAFTHTDFRKIRVVTFNGTNFIDFTNEMYVNNSSTYDLILKKSPNGIPYLLFSDKNNYKTTVLSFNGINWLQLGNISSEISGYSNFHNLEFDSDGNPIVALQDSNGNKTLLLTFNGLSWVKINEINENASYQKLAINKQGGYIMSYFNNTNKKSVVVSFNGMNWTEIIDAKIDDVQKSNVITDLKINPTTDEIYIVFGNGLVKKFGCLEPQIIKQPISHTICGGNLYSFNIETKGTDLNYIWSNGNSSQNITTSIPGTYIVTITGKCGTIISNEVNLYTILGENTKIITHPISQSVCGGNLAYFVISATGNNLNYLWNNGITEPMIATSISGSFVVTVSGTCGVEISNIVSNEILPDFLTICGGNGLINKLNTIVLPTNTLFFSSTNALLIWSTIPGASTYCIEIYKDENMKELYNSVCGLISNEYFFRFLPNLRSENYSFYYRVMSQNTNSSSEWSNLQKIEMGDFVSINKSYVKENNDFSIFPNPSNDEIVIKCFINDENILEIYNLTGEIIYSEKINSNSIKINIQLSIGIYFIKIGNKIKKLIRN